MLGKPESMALGTWSIPAAGQPAANAAAIVTIAAQSADSGANSYRVVDEILFSYSAIPTNGLLTISDGTTVLTLSITGDGPGAIVFAHPYVAAANTAITVTLAAGGAGVSGKLNVHSR
jgi:hypothetical protein